MYLFIYFSLLFTSGTKCKATFLILFFYIFNKNAMQKKTKQKNY